MDASRVSNKRLRLDPGLCFSVEGFYVYGVTVLALTAHLLGPTRWLPKAFSRAASRGEAR